MSDLAIVQSIIALGAVALMAFTTYNGLKLRADDKRLQRDVAERKPAE